MGVDDAVYDSIGSVSEDDETSSSLNLNNEKMERKVYIFQF